MLNKLCVFVTSTPVCDTSSSHSQISYSNIIDIVKYNNIFDTKVCLVNTFIVTSWTMTKLKTTYTSRTMKNVKNNGMATI